VGADAAAGGEEDWTTGDAVSDRRETLRQRPINMRAELIETLARDGIDGGMLAFLGNVGAALDEFDRMPVEAKLAVRAVVSDDGTRIRLTLYSEAGDEAGVTLTPSRAVMLADRLIGVAVPRLKNE
jgi:hypothetical protein